MIRCNNCMKLFKDENELIDILETNINGVMTHTIYDGDYKKLDDKIHTVFDGCPNCLTDEYLMDL